MLYKLYHMQGTERQKWTGEETVQHKDIMIIESSGNCKYESYNR